MRLAVNHTSGVSDFRQGPGRLLSPRNRRGWRIADRVSRNPVKEWRRAGWLKGKLANVEALDEMTVSGPQASLSLTSIGASPMKPPPQPSESTSKGRSTTAMSERRIDPRWIPEEEKQVGVSIQRTVSVRNESEGGMCARIPIESQVPMGQEIQVEDDGKLRTGRVCWTTTDESGPHRLVGMAWVSTQEMPNEGE